MFMPTSMFNQIRAHLPVTMVAKNGFHCCQRQPKQHGLTNNIGNNNNVPCYLFWWTITWSLATIMSSKKGSGEKQMHLCCGPFWWPYEHVGVIQTALPDAACPGLPWKPLDAAIRWLLSPCCPGSRQGNSKQNNVDLMHQLCWPFWWPRQCAGTIPCTSPHGGGTGLW
jgi:hypothetical protein